MSLAKEKLTDINTTKSNNNYRQLNSPDPSALDINATHSTLLDRLILMFKP
jgi:hypothetical protein